MKKRIILVALFGIFIGVNNVSAKASASISVSTTSTIVGNSGTATITISSGSSDDYLGQVYGTFSCGGLGSKSISYVDSSNEKKTSISYTISWTAKSVGTYTCSVSGLQAGILNYPEDGVYSVSASSKTITVISGNSDNSSVGSSGGSSSGSSGGTTADKKNYSSDNTLSSLSIDGYDISPSFSKDKTDYTLEVDESVEKIKVNAKANDSKASVSGTGEVSLSSGDNTIEICVTAENGNEKVYKIVVTVKDQNPINVTIDKKNYTVVKKNNGVIDTLEYYNESSVKIDDQDVISYVNDKSKITLVILKDEDNKASYFVYDADNNTYELYNEIKIGNNTLYIMNMDNSLIPDGYSKYTFTYDDTKIVGYKLDKGSKFYLIYALNVETGEKSLYVYDEKEKTIQRYDEELSNYFLSEASSEIKKYRNYFYVTLSVLGAVIIVLVVSLIVNLKKKKRKNKVKI